MSAKKKASPTRARAREVLELALSVERRVSEDGTIHGWRGMNLDLDALEAAVRLLRLEMRGISDVPP